MVIQLSFISQKAVNCRFFLFHLVSIVFLLNFSFLVCIGKRNFDFYRSIIKKKQTEICFFLF